MNSSTMQKAPAMAAGKSILRRLACSTGVGEKTLRNLAFLEGLPGPVAKFGKDSPRGTSLLSADVSRALLDRLDAAAAACRMDRADVIRIGITRMVHEFETSGSITTGRASVERRNAP
jgi:hypothetical protein